jgi:hypothetical protein
MGSKNSWIVKLNSNLNRTEVEGLCTDAEAANVTWHPESKRGPPLSIHPSAAPPPYAQVSRSPSNRTRVSGGDSSRVGRPTTRLCWLAADVGYVTDVVELLRCHPGIARRGARAAARAIGRQEPLSEDVRAARVAIRHHRHRDDGRCGARRAAHRARRVHRVHPGTYATCCAPCIASCVEATGGSPVLAMSRDRSPPPAFLRPRCDPTQLLERITHRGRRAYGSGVIRR